MILRSTAFQDGNEIPSRYTADGENVSPPLAWSDLPEGTKSLALIVDDPDAPDPAKPQRTFVHWVVYNLPADAQGLPEAVSVSTLPGGTRLGATDWKAPEYGGPKPPVGRHRYFFKLYALDTHFDQLGEMTKSQLEQAMQGHLLGEAQLVGTYQARA